MTGQKYCKLFVTKQHKQQVNTKKVLKKVQQAKVI